MKKLVNDLSTDKKYAANKDKGEELQNKMNELVEYSKNNQAIVKA